MSSDADDLKSYEEGTRRGGDKLVRKYVAKASITAEKLKSSDTHDAWEKGVTSAEAKAAYSGKLNKITTADLTEPMKQRGKANYLASTGSEHSKTKWATNSKPHRDLAKQISKDKKPAITIDEKLANVRDNMEKQMALKKSRLGV